MDRINQKLAARWNCTKKNRSCTGLLKSLSVPVAYIDSREVSQGHFVDPPASGREGYLLHCNKLSLRQQCPLPRTKSNSVLGCNSKSITSRLKEMVLHLYSALVSPSLDTASSFGFRRTQHWLRGVRQWAWRCLPRWSGVNAHGMRGGSWACSAWARDSDGELQLPVPNGW